MNGVTGLYLWIRLTASHEPHRIASALMCLLILILTLSCSEKEDIEIPPSDDTTTYILTVDVGAGIEGYPPTGTYEYSEGVVINYGYRELPDYTNLVVKLDSVEVGVSGTFEMDSDHTLTVTCDLRVLWRFHADHAGYYCSPAVANDGTIYFSTGSYTLAYGYQPGELYALSPNGTLKWAYYSDKSFFSPAIGENGWIYLMDHDYKVYAFTPEGTLVWTFDDFEYTFVKRDMGQRTPAIGADGTVYVGADGLYALDPETGTPMWHFIRYPGTRECIASPVIGDDNTIYVTIGQDSLYAINPDGTRKWAFGFDNPYELSFATPAIDVSGVIYITSEAFVGISKIYAIDPDGSLKWKYEVEGARPVRASPAIGEDGTIYIATKAISKEIPSRVIALAPDGSELWHLDIPTIHETPDDVYSSPTVGADGTIYFGAETGWLYAVSREGTLIWDHKLIGINWSGPAIIDDGTLYVAGIDDGMIYTGALCAVITSSYGLASSPWPKFHHDNRNTGRFGAQ